MKLFIFALIIFLTFDSAFASRREAISAQPPLVTVNSTYKTSSGRFITVRGQGIYVVRGSGKYVGRTNEDRHFVLTVAHVSGGNNLDISVGGQKVRVLGTISDSRHDLAIYEIESPQGPSQPLAVWNKQLHSFINLFHEKGTLFKSDFGLEEIKPFFVGNEASDARDSAGFSSRPPFIALPPRYSNSSARPFDEKSANLLDSTMYQTLSGQLYVKAKIAPGMSGSPAFITEVFTSGGVQIVSILAGLASQYSLLQTHSFITPYNALNSLMNGYMSGQRGEFLEKWNSRTIKTVWRHDGEGTYRAVVDAKTQEVLVSESSKSPRFDRNASEGTNGNGAEGTNGNGAEGTNGNGSEGTNGNGGDGPALKPVPGLTFNGELVRVLKITNSSNRESIYVQANWSALDLILKMKSRIKLELVKNPNWLDLADKRALVLKNEIVGGLVERTSIHRAGNKFVIGATRRNIQAPGATDEVRFEVTEKSLDGTKYMLVKSQTSNREYRIDMDDISTLNLEHVKWNKTSSNPDEIWNAAVEAYKSVSVEIDPVL